ncbi:hypothetical protein [Formosa sp. A9]|uniref:hypothetical protein n=1 Tax=Formosa sp. A9 TaxID=3442641 RepID=UPI003EB89A2A
MNLKIKTCSFLLIFFLGIVFNLHSQETTSTKVWRINILNPSVELELPTGRYSTFSAGVGIGYGGAYPNLSYSNNGFVYMIAPFIDVQEKWFYNFEKRHIKEKNTSNNSGNFISARFLTRGNSIADNFSRTSNFDFSVGPTWGLQRSYNNKIHFLFDMGPIIYFDTKGNSGFYPIMLQLNFGFDI